MGKHVKANTLSHTPGREELDEEERLLQEGIRLSLMETESPGPATNSSAARKRGPSKQLARDVVKKPRSVIQMAFPNGGLRITRTPGRSRAKNCVNLIDVIHKDSLLSACLFAFYIANEELFEHLPLSDTSDSVPIYIGRDANEDPMLEACQTSGASGRVKLSKKQLQNLRPQLEELHRNVYGPNYHAFYAWSPGSSHSKILALVYPGFLRIVITSCNLMNIDTELGDNHWYIHDLPEVADRQDDHTSTFESDLLAHLQALGTPVDFINSIRGRYDYSTVKVHLVSSVPGTHSGIKAQNCGLLRLRQVIRSLDLDLAQKKRQGKLQLEVCAGSLGKLSARWLDGFYDCALGRKYVEVGEDCDVPSGLKLFYPTIEDVRSADEEAQHGASNIGCHTRPWKEAPKALKNIFHHYRSKDSGKLFHQKLILAYDPTAPTSLPYYVYMGSANLSASAWGTLEKDKRENMATCDLKLIKTSNFECGVLIPGNVIEGLLEPGTSSWQDAMVPYDQAASRYDTENDIPWNSPSWVKDFREDWNGQ